MGNRVKVDESLTLVLVLVLVLCQPLYDGIRKPFPPLVSAPTGTNEHVSRMICCCVCFRQSSSEGSKNKREIYILVLQDATQINLWRRWAGFGWCWAEEAFDSTAGPQGNAQGRSKKKKGLLRVYHRRGFFRELCTSLHDAPATVGLPCLALRR